MLLRRIGPDDVEEVARFFSILIDDLYFQPHPMTFEQATEICQNRTRDLYAGGFDHGRILAYGFLRGWDRYPHPSLGIAVNPVARGSGMGRQMMEHLHQEARDAGASRIRLRVHPQNTIARELYRSMGYMFSGEVDREQLVGWLDL